MHTGSMEAMSDAGAAQKRPGPTGRPIFGPGRRCSLVTSSRDVSSSRLAPITKSGPPNCTGYFVMDPDLSLFRAEEFFAFTEDPINGLGRASIQAESTGL